MKKPIKILLFTLAGIGHTAIVAIIAFFVMIFVFLAVMILWQIFPTVETSHNIEKWTEIQQNQSYLPSFDEMGNYENISCKYQHKQAILLDSNTYILIASYSEENFHIQKEIFLNSYSFQNFVIENVRDKELEISGSFSLDGYDFKLLSLEEYELTHPKKLAFFGFSNKYGILFPSGYLKPFNKKTTLLELFFY